MSESLVLDRQGHVAIATLNRPNKFNALDPVLRSEICSVAADLKDDDSVRVVIWTGAGRGFCSGADLTGPRGATDSTPSQSERLDELMWVGHQALAIYEMDKPTIAAVNGVAAGAGMSLALACDMRIGDRNTRFRTVFVERSLSPDAGLTFFLPRIIGYSRAADLIFTSRSVEPEEAFRLGLLDRLVEGEDLLDQAVALAMQLASLPPLAMRSSKRVLQHNMNVGLREALKYEIAGVGYARRARRDAAEAMSAFTERRTPVFTGE